MTLTPDEKPVIDQHLMKLYKVEDVYVNAVNNAAVSFGWDAITMNS